MTVEVGYKASKLSCCKMERKHPFYLPGKVRKKKHIFLGSSKEVLTLLSSIVKKSYKCGQCEVTARCMHLRVPSFGMKKINTVLVTFVLTKVAIKIGQGSNRVTEQSQVLKEEGITNVCRREQKARQVYTVVYM